MKLKSSHLFGHVVFLGRFWFSWLLPGFRLGARRCVELGFGFANALEEDVVLGATEKFRADVTVLVPQLGETSPEAFAKSSGRKYVVKAGGLDSWGDFLKLVVPFVLKLFLFGSFWNGKWKVWP